MKRSRFKGEHAAGVSRNTPLRRVLHRLVARSSFVVFVTFVVKAGRPPLGL